MSCSKHYTNFIITKQFVYLVEVGNDFYEDVRNLITILLDKSPNHSKG